MNRRSVIRCILGLAAAPKILAEVDFKPLVIPTTGATKSLMADFQLLTPQFYKTMVEKYGNTNFTTLMEVVGSKEVIANTDSIWFEMRPKTIQS